MMSTGTIGSSVRFSSLPRSVVVLAAAAAAADVAAARILVSRLLRLLFLALQCCFSRRTSTAHDDTAGARAPLVRVMTLFANRRLLPTLTQKRSEGGRRRARGESARVTSEKRESAHCAESEGADRARSGAVRARARRRSAAFCTRPGTGSASSAYARGTAHSPSRGRCAATCTHLRMKRAMKTDESIMRCISSAWRRAEPPRAAACANEAAHTFAHQISRARVAGVARLVLDERGTARARAHDIPERARLGQRARHARAPAAARSRVVARAIFSACAACHAALSSRAAAAAAHCASAPARAAGARVLEARGSRAASALRPHVDRRCCCLVVLEPLEQPRLADLRADLAQHRVDLRSGERREEKTRARAADAL